MPLKKVGLNVETKDVRKKAFDSNHIMCSEIFLESEPIIASIDARIRTLKDMAGIEDAKFMHEAKLKEKRPWLPPIISTVVYAITVLGVLWSLEKDYSLKYDFMTLNREDLFKPRQSSSSIKTQETKHLRPTHLCCSSRACPVRKNTKKERWQEEVKIAWLVTKEGA